MKLITKTPLQQNIESIESAANTAILAAASAVHALNNSFNVFWDLPDDELTELLQYLLDQGELQSVLNKHYSAATNLNEILDIGEYEGARAIYSISREFIINEFGTVSLVYPPIEEPVIEQPLI